jgi:ribosomal 50S subunit-recycling heat shock protein
MSEEQEPIRIVIPVEEAPPLVAERKSPKARERVANMGGQIARVAQRVWASGVRRKATRGVQRGTRAVLSRGRRIVRDQVVSTAERQAQEKAAQLQTRLRATDWKQATKTGVAGSLRWMSNKLAQLAARFTPAEKSPPS